jgi:hypothetical protein
MPKRSDIDDDDNDDQDDGEEGAPAGDDFDRILAAITGANQPNRGAVDSNSLLLMFMMQQQKQAQADKQDFLKLAISVLPALLKKEVDPLMMQLLGNALGGKNQEQFMSMMMEMNNRQNQSSMDMVTRTMEATNKMKDEIVAARLGELEEKAERGPTGSVWLDVMREVKGMVEPIIAARVNGQAAKVAVEGQSATMRVGGPAKPERVGKDPVAVALYTLKQAFENRERIDARGMRGLASKLASVIMDHDELTDCVIDQNDEGVTAICKPYVIADPDLLKFLQSDGAAQWVSEFLSKRIAPILDTMCAVEDEDAPVDDAAAEVTTVEHPDAPAASPVISMVTPEPAKKPRTIKGPKPYPTTPPNQPQAGNATGTEG